MNTAWGRADVCVCIEADFEDLEPSPVPLTAPAIGDECEVTAAFGCGTRTFLMLAAPFHGAYYDSAAFRPLSSRERDARALAVLLKGASVAGELVS